MNGVALYSVDPGLITGFGAWCGQDRFLLNSLRAMEAVSDLEDMISGAVDMNEHVIVVAERFTLTSVKHTRQYDALEVIGALRYLCNRHGAEFELQSRAARMRVSNSVARRFGDWTDDHQLSALKHGIVAATRHRILDPRLLLES